MMAAIQKANQARKIFHDWLGEGGQTVSLEDAQHRADVCLRCPHNYKGSWIWNIATSMAIASQIRLRDAMKIRLNGDENLKVCELCGCKLQLKVHVPFAHIYRHMPLEQFDKFPAFCWMKQELGKKTQS